MISKVAEKAMGLHEDFVTAHAREIEFAHKLASESRIDRSLASKGHLVPPIMGASLTVPSHPLAPPTISGTEITVDVMLNSPTRIQRVIEDLTLQRLLLDRLFTGGGNVTGGAVVYDEVQQNEIYGGTDDDGNPHPLRDVEPIAPGAGYPIFEAERLVPKVAAVEKWGGKVFNTDEARDRNDIASFQRKMRQLANTITRRLNLRCLEKVDALVIAKSRTASTVDWTNVVTAGSGASSAELWPVKTFSQALQQQEEDEMGIEFDLVILNPQEWGSLITIYGGLANVRDLFQGLGINQFYVSNRQPAGKVKFVASGQVGGYRVEQPLRSFSWRDEDNDRTWTKASARPVMYADNPFAIFEFTGAAG
jgi:hypothetical protein